MGQRYTTRLEKWTSHSPSTSLSLCCDLAFFQNILSMPTRSRQVQRIENKWMRTNEWWLSLSQNLSTWGKWHGAQTCAKANASERKCDYFFFSLACHAPAILLCTLLPCCFGCEWSWACASKLLPSSEIGKRARVGIMSWQLCKVETETLHQVWASTLCRAHHSGAY